MTTLRDEPALEHRPARAASPATRERPRPGSQELLAAATELAASGSSAFKGTARRYSLCTADAEDAYQRSLEILMTKAPTTERSELRPWLHTVIKHEALALRHQRERLLAAGDVSDDAAAGGVAPGPDDGAAERERLRQTAEALGQLKPSESQCLLLKALGYSYDEISLRTGFSWTKVNRSLTEGRRRFLDRYDQIRSGERCARFEELLSPACDGELSGDEERQLREHLRACHGCRAALRGYRALPGRLAGLLPPIVVPMLQKESWWSRLHDSVTVAAGERVAALASKLQQAGDALAAQKTVAVVASTAALAGGTVAHERSDHHRERHRSAASARVEPKAKPSSPVAAPSPVSPSAQPPAGGQSPSPDKPSKDDPPAKEPAAGEAAGPAGEFGLEAAEPTRQGAEPTRQAAAVEQPVSSPPVHAATTTRTSRQATRAAPAETQEFGP